MTPPKKAAKKVATKHAPHDEAAKDMRRAYEHLGRVEVLHASLEKEAAGEIATLSKLAQQELTAGRMKDAADLLRAAEHLSFGALSSPKKEAHVDPKLVEALQKEFDHKLKKAEEKRSEAEQQDPTVEKIANAVQARAQEAFEAGAYRRGLELARGAEALAHVQTGGTKKLGTGN